MKIINYLIYLPLLLFFCISCNKEDSQSIITVNKSNLLFDNPSRDQTYYLRISSNTDWVIECSDAWLEIYEFEGKGDSKIQIKALKNTTGEKRFSKLTVNYKNKDFRPIDVTIEQLDRKSNNILNCIQDDNFKTFLIKDVFKSEYATHGDALEILTMECQFRQLHSLKGIEYFKELITLDCSDNSLYALDISENKYLETLVCSSNYLSSLNLIHNSSLGVIYCQGNELKILDISQNYKLTWLDCSFNPIEDQNVKIPSKVYKTAILNPTRESSIYCISE